MIAVEMTAGRIRVAVPARANSASAAVWTERLPHDLTPENAQALGVWLKGHLAQVQIAAGDAIVLLGRGIVSPMSLRVPIVPDAELPSVVSFASEGLSSQTGPTVLDFQPGPVVSSREGQTEEQEVLAAVVAQSTLQSIRTLLTTAGLTPKKISLRPYATRAGLPTESATHAVVLANDETLEISVFSGPHLRLCRSMPVADGSLSDERLLNEFRRTVAAFHGQDHQDNVTSATIIGVRAESRSRLIEEAVGTPTRGMELSPEDALNRPLQNVLAEKLEAPIDFLKPKKAQARTSPSRTMFLVAGLAAVIVAGTAWTFYSRALARRDAEIGMLQEELNKTAQQLTEYKPTVERHRVIREWTNGGDPILDELQEVAAALPDTSDLFLTGLEYTAGQNDQPGTLKLDGLARDQRIVTFAQTLLASQTGHYAVIPRGLDPGADVGEFVWRFGLDLVVEPMPTSQTENRAAQREKYLTELEPPAGKRRESLTLARTVKTPAKPNASQPSSEVAKGEPKESTKEDKKEDKKGFLDTKIEEIRKLPPEEREAAIDAVPKVFQKRVRKALGEGGE